jgi:GT2 family glycosyltransferase
MSPAKAPVGNTPPEQGFHPIRFGNKGLNGTDYANQSFGLLPSRALALPPLRGWCRASVTFWEEFFRVLSWRPFQALAGLYWHLTRRKVRARNRLRLGAMQAPHAYFYWTEKVEDNVGLAARAASIVQEWPFKPKFSILLQISAAAASESVERVIESAKKQFYAEWELIICGPGEEVGRPEAGDDTRVIFLPAPANDAQALTAGMDAARGDYVVPVSVGQILSASALFRFGEALQAKQRPSIIYGDQDEIDPRGHRSRPWFKPQWDEEMFFAQDYLSEACAVELSLAKSVSPFAMPSGEAAVFTLLLSASRAATRPIVHVPHIVCHVSAEMKRSDQSARVSAVADHLKSLGAKPEPGPFGTVKVDWPLPQVPPKVCIVIPTRDQVNLLRACVNSVLELTNYPQFEILIIDNGSTDPETLSYLAQLCNNSKVRVKTYDHPYNYSAINNFAAESASAPYLCLLNNDTEVIVGDWLLEMMRYAVRPEFGAVGAKLLYEDGSIQHAGVIVGICEAAGHAHRFTRSGDPGYFGQPHLTHVVSAVTAACLVVEKNKFMAVGGFDAERLKIAFNDVDLCLKLQKAGWRNVYVPHAVLLHHESKSRGLDSSPRHVSRYMRELAVLQGRWGTKLYRDPRHNPNLNQYSETFILRMEA